MDSSLPGFSVHGILQIRIPEWVAIPFSRGFSTQGLNQGVLLCSLTPYLLSQQRSPYIFMYTHTCVYLSIRGFDIVQHVTVIIFIIFQFHSLMTIFILKYTSPLICPCNLLASPSNKFVILVIVVFSFRNLFA